MFGGSFLSQTFSQLSSNSELFTIHNDRGNFLGFILDGYPRTLDQALYLNKFLKEYALKIDYIFNIQINQFPIPKMHLHPFPIKRDFPATSSILNQPRHTI